MNRVGKADRTSTFRKELDKPGMETHTVRGSEPDVLVGEPESGRSHWVGLGESWKDWNVDQSLLESDQQSHPGNNQPSHSVQQRVHVRHHFWCSAVSLFSRFLSWKGEENLGPDELNSASFWFSGISNDEFRNIAIIIVIMTNGGTLTLALF